MPPKMNILGTDQEQQLLQSFTRVGLTNEGRKKSALKNPIMQTKRMASPRLMSSKTQARFSPVDVGLIVKKQKQLYDEVYTDKDRAAAVSIGSYDIKQSLSIKRKQDRSDNYQIPEEEPDFKALGMREIKKGNLENAVHCISKALELNPTDISALIARSKCFIQLAEPSKALADAEAALVPDKNNVRAIYQKAEALYYLSQFEHSLMFFHRGLRLRPELNIFRLGVQKTEKAIENIIGAGTVNTDKKSKQNKELAPPSQPKTRPKTAKSSSRRLLGNLYVDKEYLENLLKNPDLKQAADPCTENAITTNVKDAISFLNNRQEFWRQQRPVTSSTKTKPITISTPFPKWY